jgi:hypothetical protein
MERVDRQRGSASKKIIVVIRQRVPVTAFQYQEAARSSHTRFSMATHLGNGSESNVPIFVRSG